MIYDNLFEIISRNHQPAAGGPAGVPGGDPRFERHRSKRRVTEAPGGLQKSSFVFHADKGRLMADTAATVHTAAERHLSHAGDPTLLRRRGLTHVTRCEDPKGKAAH